MIKYIMLLLVGIGVYIGVTYKDQIEDFVDSRPVEEVQDLLEDAKDQVSAQAEGLTEKLEDLNQ
ncbi:YtxH domain-containing protein [Photobacterium atrarenae]|uniref:YtxH domain-containing protein n=1 Tax=Photobacterium atrarenae TaxID=865757 RepID=A0ABY5GP73_9GAMM|nr:YtxH domain-containing protein [Photobacterium atrarenae]UTV30357.1 YtxH domain-containing protein [Photobacterium atrarenae]